MVASANGPERDVDDVYYSPGVHARLASLGKPGGQGWDVSLKNGEMELRNLDGDLFAEIGKVNNMYPVKFNVIPPRAALAAWTMEGGEEETTHELVGRLGKVTMVAMVKGADGKKATLITWHRWLGHPSFKTVVALVKNGAEGI